MILTVYDNICMCYNDQPIIILTIPDMCEYVIIMNP